MRETRNVQFLANRVYRALTFVNEHQPRYPNALPFLFVKIAQAQFGHADTVGLERFPNELAAHADSRIIVASLNVTDEVRHGRFLPAQFRII